MDRALDISTGQVVIPEHAFRERFRYRCTNKTCRAFVVPCLGELRQYFRHEQGVAWCPEMADEASEGSTSDEKAKRFSRLVFNGSRGWHLEPAHLNVISLACDLNGHRTDRHLFDVAAYAPAKEPVFAHPDFGGMQLPEASPIYPGEEYFRLHNAKVPALSQMVRAMAVRMKETSKGSELFRLSMPDKWKPSLKEWATSAGFIASDAPRVRWQVEDTLARPKNFKRSVFSALLSSLETASHHVSVFMGTPVSASWEVQTWVDHERFSVPTRLINLVCRFTKPSTHELYVRIESDFSLHGDWDSTHWDSSRKGKGWRRAFLVRVGGHLAIRGHVVLGSSHNGPTILDPPKPQGG